MTRFAEGRALLELPLVRHVLAQRTVPLRRRPVDCGWFYGRVLPVSSVGFNPFAGEIYYGARSRVAQWLAAPQCVRPDTDEALLDEVFFLVHDYFHVWAIGELAARLFGARVVSIPLDRDAIADLEFIYIVSEAVATTAVDFWYLARPDINPQHHRRPRYRLASAYCESDVADYRRLDPRFAVQEPDFLQRLVRTYCTGVFAGFSAEDVASHPKLRHWVTHELRMSGQQRRLARAWLRSIAGNDAPTRRDEPLIDWKSWRRRAAVRSLADDLWEIVRGHREWVTAPTRLVFARVDGPRRRALDYRFVNLQASPRWPDVMDRSVPSTSRSQLAFFTAQLVSAHRFPRNDRDARVAMRSAFERGDLARVAALLAKHRVVGEGHCGPPSMMFPS